MKTLHILSLSLLVVAGASVINAQVVDAQVVEPSSSDSDVFYKMLANPDFVKAGINRLKSFGESIGLEEKSGNMQETLMRCLDNHSWTPCTHEECPKGYRCSRIPRQCDGDWVRFQILNKKKAEEFYKVYREAVLSNKDRVNK